MNTITERNAIAASSATSWSSDRHSGYGTFVLSALGADLVGRAKQATQGAEAAMPCAPFFGAAAGFSVETRTVAVIDIAQGTHVWSPPT